MARTPRAGVSKTSGQGVSRRAYQSAYSLGQRGTGGGIKTELGKPTPNRGREYGKTGASKVDRRKGINVSYGDTIEPSDLKNVLNTPPKRR